MARHHSTNDPRPRPPATSLEDTGERKPLWIGCSADRLSGPW